MDHTKITEKKSSLNKTKFDAKMYTMIIALISIWVIFAIATKGNFLTARNISNLIRQMSTTGVLAIGMVFVIISGEIDLSVGSLLGLLGGIAAILNVWFELNAFIVIIITLLIGAIFGLWNGYWVAYKKVPSFIVTLAGMLVFRGLLIGISKGLTIAPLSSGLRAVGQLYLPIAMGYLIAAAVICGSIFMMLRVRKSQIEHGLEVPSMKKEVAKMVGIAALVIVFTVVLNSYRGIPLPVFIMLVLGGVFGCISLSTVFGRRIYAIGGNIEAAKLSGINVSKTKLIIYVVNGMLVAVAGILLTSRLNAASVSAGTNAELDAIAACVIGGTSMMGGAGSVGGALVGALVMASIDNGMSILNTPPFWQFIVKGMILLIAVWVDISSKNKK
ncbi:xylose ABC transporter membrane protein [Anaerovirgula multivorans]|uniref:Xylose transport system permease protein XylH n=1 Tax=Anaerovirgula multivorans TaxID=312168 RepID=A0A239G1C5_9FIRM|nr:sugar ABC transporter permease [Anaerovirgula multivorans]SNS62971.1 xylose ABC transporter membrane protein [Anaerovirgula multivorans]